jgi:hypothetical protein
VLGAISVANICRSMPVGVAQRLRNLAPINSPNWPAILPFEPAFDQPRTAR